MSEKHWFSFLTVFILPCFRYFKVPFFSCYFH